MTSTTTHPDATATPARPLLIGGRWCEGSGTLDSLNPASGLLNHRVAAAGEREVDEAVQVATQAAADSAWRDMLPHRRAALLHAIGASNTCKQLSIATPFGGFKASGIGCEKGIGGLRLYQQSKGIYVGLEP